jgi:tRNA pseudouridine13 synthase
MKLKRLPEDFQVEELTALVPGEGPFALYRLTKRGLGTPEAVDAVLKRWKIPRQLASYGGLKDRHAWTQQALTIEHGPARGLKQTNIELAYLGQTDRPFTSADIAANRFRIVLRDLSDDDVLRLRSGLEGARRYGVPNYFDEQRFGSRGQSREFIAQAWAKGDYERAIWLTIADPHPHDRPRQRNERQHLRAHWGDWETCRAGVEFPPARQIVAHLAAHPDDFRGALQLVRHDMRWLYLSAFQSFLWNRVLTALIRRQCREEQIVHMMLDGDEAAFYWSLDDAQRESLAATQVPLPSGRLRDDVGQAFQPDINTKALDTPPSPASLLGLVDEVLGELGLTRKDLKIDYPRGSFFSKGDRPAIFLPQNLEDTVADDDLYPGQRKLTLAFDLPRGSYATILIRRIEVGQQG